MAVKCQVKGCERVAIYIINGALVCRKHNGIKPKEFKIIREVINGK